MNVYVEYDDYGWIIDEDHLGDGDEGVMGPAWLSASVKRRLLAGEGEPFQLLDDDGELYYTGRQIGGDGSEALDDFGLPNAGCTMLRQKVNGEWEVTIS